MYRSTFACRILLALLLVATTARAQTDTTNTLPRGSALLQAGKFQDAIQVLTAVTEREPQNGRAWTQMGLAYYSIKDYPRALAANLRATDRPLARPTALYNAGLMYALMGQKDSAFAFLFRARETGRIDVTQIMADSDGASLRSDPRYRQLFPTREQYAHPFVEPVTILGEWDGEATNDQFGWIARNIGDVDGDRIADFATSAPTNGAAGANAGKIYVYSTRTRRLLWSATGTPGDRLGFGIEAAGDVNRDGVPDVIASAPGGQAAYLYSGRDGSKLRTLAAPVRDAGFGNAVTDLGDLNRDGYDDVAVGAPQDDSTGTDAGRAYVFSGRDGTILQTLAGDSAGHNFGNALGGATRNGTTWIVVGALRAGKRQTGSTYVFQGMNSRPAFIIESDSTGAAQGGMFVSVVGDVNHDGVPDIFSADFPNSALGPSTGRIYVRSGKDGAPLLTVTGEGPGNGFGVGPSDAGDVNGDGFDDIATGAWQFGSAAPSGGKIYVISGKDGVTLRTITGNVPGETLGFDSTGMGDVNGDGVPDLLVTSAWSTINGFRSGRVFVLSGK
jgi:hypothetical protein